jgi:hypothetical protein
MENEFQGYASQPGNIMDCIFHVCTLSMCITYDWLLNYQVLNVNGMIIVNYTMRYEKKRVAAEPLRGGIHGFFCEQQGGIGLAPNVHPTWKSWKRLRGGLVEVALGFIYRAAGSMSNLELTVQDELTFPQGQSNRIYDCSPLNQPLVI